MKGLFYMGFATALIALGYCAPELKRNWFADIPPGAEHLIPPVQVASAVPAELTSEMAAESFSKENHAKPNNGNIPLVTTFQAGKQTVRGR